MREKKPIVGTIVGVLDGALDGVQAQLMRRTHWLYGEAVRVQRHISQG